MLINNTSIFNAIGLGRIPHFLSRPVSIAKSLILSPAILCRQDNRRAGWRVKMTGILRLLLLFMIAFGVSVRADDSSAQQILKDLLNPNGAQIQINPGNGNIIVNPISCLPPFIKNNNNKCVCPPGKKKQGNTCVFIPVQIFCQAPQVPNANGTQCICPIGTKKIGNNCIQIPIQIFCQAPFVPNNNGTKCVCPIGKQKQGNTCVPIPIQILCQSPFIANSNGTKCVCPVGLTKVGNTCAYVPVQIQCNQPFVPNANNTQCVCPAGLKQVGNSCQLIKVTPQCNWPFVYSNARKACVCAKGYRLNSSGSKCLRQQATPVVPRSTVAQIQSCLGRLGYNAGPADGAIGGRTRSAWSQFQRDENLRSRPDSLSDDVTQDRLFQACAKLDQVPIAPQPSPPPLAPAPPSDDGSAIGLSTNFDPDKGYPPLQCATSEIVKLLKGLADDGKEIGICGEVCVPIPQGMTQEQVNSTAANINWCLNCTTIGEDQMICTANPEDGG